MLSRVLGMFSAIVLTSLSLSLANAQSARVSITGHVVDSGGAVLPGAHVELQPTGLSTSSNGQGEFTLSNVPAGDYTLTVTYVGFATFTKPITVAARQAARVDASLKVASANEEITVTSERAHGEAEAINEMRETDNILQVLPVEVITSLPNNSQRYLKS